MMKIAAPLVLLSALVLPLDLHGQARPPGLEQPGDWYPLGGIEAKGEPGEDGPGDAPSITVKHVHEGGLAARGGLAVGDVIYAAGGRKLKSRNGLDGVIARFEEAVEAAEAKRPSGEKPVLLELAVVTSGGERAQREVPVRYYGRHASACPAKCEKCQRILKEALDYLKAEQHEDGHFAKQKKNQNQAVASASLAGLAWLGWPQGGYEENVARAATWVTENAGTDSFPEEARRSSAARGNWNQSNWAYGYGALLLAELAARGKKEHEPALKRFVDTLAATQEESGGWAHGPGGPNALDYLELEVMSNFCLAAMGMAQRVNVEIDRAKMRKGVEWVKACTQGGGVAYSTRPGQLGHGDPGRTAGAFWAFRQLGLKGKVVGQMASFYQRGIEELPEGHACPTMHILAGALASSQLGKYKAYWKIYRPLLMASRDAGGAFDYRPSEESRRMGVNSDRSWGGTFVTAHYAIVMLAGQGNYELLDTD